MIEKEKNFSIQCRVPCAHVGEGVVHVNKDINLRIGEKTLNHTSIQHVLLPRTFENIKLTINTNYRCVCGLYTQ